MPAHRSTPRCAEVTAACPPAPSDRASAIMVCPFSQTRWGESICPGQRCRRCRSRGSCQPPYRKSRLEGVAAGHAGVLGARTARRWLTVGAGEGSGTSSPPGPVIEVDLDGQADNHGRDDPRAPHPRRESTCSQARVGRHANAAPIELLSRSPRITLPGVMPGWCAERPAAATSMTRVTASLRRPRQRRAAPDASGSHVGCRAAA
jgi:hypothetical protein